MRKFVVRAALNDLLCSRRQCMTCLPHEPLQIIIEDSGTVNHAMRLTFRVVMSAISAAVHVHHHVAPSERPMVEVVVMQKVDPGLQNKNEQSTIVAMLEEEILGGVGVGQVGQTTGFVPTVSQATFAHVQRVDNVDAMRQNRSRGVKVKVMAEHQMAGAMLKRVRYTLTRKGFKMQQTSSPRKV
uniref:Non-canonical purine NTP pyrophosphatase n=1 Tax=Lygus hesperus TaxID=30085 RepID=A0A0A9XPK3_LYGHE